MSEAAIGIANFVSAHKGLSFLYYAYVGWPYLLAAFLIGSIPFGLILGRLVFKSDIRQSGSGNIGAANALRSYGKGAGAIVLALDAAKGAVAVVLVRLLVFLPHSPPFLPHLPYQFGDSHISVILALAPLAGLAAVLGHCFSPWLGFRGGKGVATFFGALLALGWISPLLFAIAWILVAWRTGFASLASIGATAAVAAYITIRNFNVGDSDCAILFVCATLLLIVVRHQENIARLRQGTENRLSFAGG